LTGPRYVTRYALREGEVAELSVREAEVLELLAAGLTPERVAEQLFVSRHTVRGHVASIRRKLQVHSLTAAVGIYARHQGHESWIPERVMVWLPGQEPVSYVPEEVL